MLIAGRAHKQELVLEIDSVVLGLVPGLAASVHSLGHFTEDFAFTNGGPLGRLYRQETLDLTAKFEKSKLVLDTHSGDPKATPGNNLDQPSPRETLKSLSDGRPAHA